MKLLVVASLLVASSLALPQGGYLPPPPRAVLPQDCPQGQVPHGDGCAVPEVTRHVLVFTAPALPGAPQGQRAELPPPRVEHNVIFVRVPEAGGAAAAPLVIPPPQQRNVIYVLNRRRAPGHPAAPAAQRDLRAEPPPADRQRPGGDSAARPVHAPRGVLRQLRRGRRHHPPRRHLPPAGAQPGAGRRRTRR